MELNAKKKEDLLQLVQGCDNFQARLTRLLFWAFFFKSAILILFPGSLKELQSLG